MSDLSLCRGHEKAPICVTCRRRTEELTVRGQSYIVPPELEAGGMACALYLEPRAALLNRSSVWDRQR